MATPTLPLSVSKIWRSKIIAKGAGPVLVAIIGAVSGAVFQAYTQRAHPEATLLDATLPSLDVQSSDAEKKISVPASLRELVNKSSFFPDLDQEATLGDLSALAKAADKMKADIPSDMAWIDSWVAKLSGSIPLDEKKVFLHDLMQRNLDGIWSGGIDRNEEAYSPSQEETKGEVIIPYEASTKGYSFDLGLWLATFGSNNNTSKNAKLKPAADSIARFNQPYIRRVLINIKNDLYAMDRECSQITDQIAKVINGNEGVHVRALIVNNGGSPVSLAPWGTLRLFAAGNQPDIVIPLRASDSLYPSVKAGESRQIDLNSTETVEKIESKYSGFETLLKSETVISRLALKRADMNGKDAWIKSSTRVLSANADLEPEARRIGAALTK